MGHQNYILLCTETTLSNHPFVIPKSSCDVHLLRSLCVIQPTSSTLKCINLLLVPLRANKGQRVFSGKISERGGRLGSHQERFHSNVMQQGDTQNTAIFLLWTHSSPIGQNICVMFGWPIVSFESYQHELVENVKI